MPDYSGRLRTLDFRFFRIFTVAVLFFHCMDLLSLWAPPVHVNESHSTQCFVTPPSTTCVDIIH